MSNQRGLDRTALEALYVRLEKPLFNVVYRWVWDAEGARDLVQETFVRLWKRRRGIAPSTAEALAYWTALNLACNRRRAQKLWGWLTLDTLTRAPEAKVRPDEQLERSERRRLVRAAIDALPESLRQVVTLCELADLKYEEIAEILGVPAGTVASRRHAAMGRLEDALSEDGRE